MSRFIAVGASAESSPACAGACCAPSRRGFLRSLAAGAAVAALPKPLFAQAAPPRTAPGRPLIDVHHHFYPPEMKAALAEARGGRLAPLFRNWTLQTSLERNGPERRHQGGDLGVLGAVAMVPQSARAAPQDAARHQRERRTGIVADHPGRYGQFAFISMTDVNGSLAELAYALDTLKVDGISIATSYGDKWPGDPMFTPIFQELDRRKAVVHVHPLAPNCCVNLVPKVEDLLGRISDRFGARGVEPAVFRRAHALPEHQVHLLARRRHAADARRPR